MTGRRAVGLAYLSVAGCDPVAHVEAAGAAGFAHVGLRLAAPRGLALAHPIAGDAARLRAIGDACRRCGVAVLDVDALTLAGDTDVAAFAPLLDAAAALGARFVQVVVEDADGARVRDNFGVLCDAAAARGLVVAVEFMAWRAVRTLGEAVALAVAGGRANAAVCVDALHLARSGGAPHDVAAMPRARLGYVQLCDAPAALPVGRTLVDEARGGRLHPGAGALPLRALVASLPAEVPISVEVARSADAGRSAEARARAAAAALDRFFASCPAPAAA